MDVDVSDNVRRIFLLDMFKCDLNACTKLSIISCRGSYMKMLRNFQYNRVLNVVS